MNLEELRYALSSVSAYRNILEYPLLRELCSLLEALHTGAGETAAKDYARVFYRLCQDNCAGVGEWLEEKLRYEESPYPLSLEQGKEHAALERAARRDVESFAALAQLPCEALQSAIRTALPPELAAGTDRLPRWETGVPIDFETLRRFYLERGCGLFARYRAFLWEEGALRGVADPDCTAGDELIGYERQRGQVVANTRAMLEGNPVNNVLLYGEPGTGKSVTVKSLLSVPGFDELRLIEVRKEELGDLPNLIRMLAPRRQKFILFIDDLAFDQDDRTYSVLKTILEGGLERRPANVAVYATSNRRHLVRQTFSDRAGDEVDRGETIAEKTSLSERFGLRIPYLALDKNEFLAMAERMAEQCGLKMERETLRAEAVKFEARHPGRTPRTVRQFIASLRT